MEELMSSVRRVYVEKKPAFAVQAKDLRHELRKYLGVSGLTGVRVLIRYDVENISDDVFEKACKTVFAEPPVDTLYKESFEMAENARVFSVEFLPGQFDQRADSAVQCVKFLNEEEEPVIRSATTYVIEGEVSDEEFEAIKHHCINPVDSREIGMEKPETLVAKFEEPADVAILDGFQDMPEAELKKRYDSLNLAMTFKDFLHIQNYFKSEEHRDPSMTEIRVLDTYWSDHCRHTTFSTELKNVAFTDGYYREPIEGTYQKYLADRAEIFKGRNDKFVCLMDLALMAMRKLKKEGKLDDQEESDEINACSIVVPVEIDGKTEEHNAVIKERRNGQGAEVAGVTVEGKVAYLSLVQLQAGVTWQKSHYTRPEKWSKDSSVPAEKRIFRTPDWYGYFTATYSPVKPLNIALSGTYTGSMIVQHMKGYIPKDIAVTTPDFFDMNLKISYDFSLYKFITLQLNAGIQNIFNAYQRDFDRGKERDSGYIYGPSMPRSYFAGAKLMF